MESVATSSATGGRKGLRVQRPDRAQLPSSPEEAPRSTVRGGAIPAPYPRQHVMLCEREKRVLYAVRGSGGGLLSEWNVRSGAGFAARSTLARRHEQLRASYRRERGGFVRVSVSAEAVELKRDDLTHLRGERAVAEVQRLAWEDGRTPFDLGAGPLLRARLFTLSSTDHVLALTVHHLAADRWSSGVMARWTAWCAVCWCAGGSARRASAWAERQTIEAAADRWEQVFVASAG